MLKGIHLTLMIGPAVPVPAPDFVVNALINAQVTNSADRNGFQLSFSVDKNSVLLTSMLPAGYFDPIVTRVMIIATINGTPNVLMDGFVTNQELAPSNEAGKSILTITGEDVSLAMDLVQIVVPFPAMPDVAKVYFLLAPFAVLGIVPVVIPPEISVLKTPTEGWDGVFGKTHREYLKELAKECGYTFFIQSGPVPGQNIAYFGPDINLPVPQPALTINMDAHSNVESLNFSLNGLAKKIRVFSIYDPITKKIPIPIPLPNIDILKPPLGQRPIPPSKVEFAPNGAMLSATEAAKEILGFLMTNSPAITANGSLDVLRYNGLLRPRMLVGVRGAGWAYDGMYYVDSVTHTIKQGEYKQSFTLSRDGLISNTPRIAV